MSSLVQTRGKFTLIGTKCYRFRACWILVTLLLLGCTPTEPAAPTQTLDSPRAAPVKVDAPTTDQAQPEASEAEEQLLSEAWHVVHIEGHKIGYLHETTRETEIDGEKLLVLVSEQKVTIRRSGQTVGQYLKVTSFEKPNGRVVGFETDMVSGASVISFSGRYRGGKMEIETATAGKTVKSSIAWDPNWGGPFADQLSLERRPMKPGEKRTLRALMAGMTDVGEIELKAIGKESTELLDGERELLRIETVSRVKDTVIPGIVWATDDGDVVKMWADTGLETEIYRTTKEVALRAPDKEFDLGARTMVKIARPIEMPHNTKRIVYRASLKRGDPSKAFANSPTQLVKRIDDHTAEITVRALRPDSAPAADGFATPATPTDADKLPNNLIQSDDEAIVAMADAADETDAWRIASVLESRVGKFITHSNDVQAIASATDVIRSRQGDCTEHAVLLAALCRARGIPTRVSTGLVYVSRQQSFGYHMWNEVWIDGQWIPMDATLGRGGIGAAHIKVSDSDLSSASPVSALLPVIEVIGQLELEIVSVE